MERQRCSVLCPGWSDHWDVAYSQKESSDLLYSKNKLWYPPCPMLKMSVNNYWSGIVHNLGGNRLQTVTNKVFTAFIEKTENDLLTAPSWKLASPKQHWLLDCHHGLPQRNVANIVYVPCFDCFWKSKGSRRHTGSTVNEISCDGPRGCGRIMPDIFANNGCHINV